MKTVLPIGFNGGQQSSRASDLTRIKPS